MHFLLDQPGTPQVSKYYVSLSELNMMDFPTWSARFMIKLMTSILERMSFMNPVSAKQAYIMTLWFAVNFTRNIV